jgi:hypothetical protein
MRFVSALIAGGAVASLCLASLSAPLFAQSAAVPNAPSSQAAPQSAPVAPLKLQDLPPDPHTPTPEELAQEAAARTRMQIQQVAAAQKPPRTAGARRRRLQE